MAERNASIVCAQDQFAVGDGIGKSVLATAVVNDPDIVTSFGAERYWISFGKDRRAADAQRELLRGLKREDVAVANTVDGRQKLQQALSGRRRLIVLDDVRSADQASAFEGLEHLATFVITTRHPSIARLFNAETVPLEPLNEEQSAELFLQWAGLADDALSAVARRTVLRCGGFPIAVGIAGALASSGVPWSTLDDVLGIADRLARAGEPKVNSRADVLSRLIALSFSRLPPHDRIALVRCAVLPNGRPIPASAIGALCHDLPGVSEDVWGLKALCERIYGTALWRCETAENGQPAVSISDAVLAFLSEKLEDRASAHVAILEGYRRQRPNGWGSHPVGDEYLFDHLAHHLSAAAMTDELQSLVFDYGWMSQRIYFGDIHGVLSDALLCDDVPEILELTRVLRASAGVLSRDPAQLPAQLLGRLRSGKGRLTTQILEQAAKAIPTNVLVPRDAGHLAEIVGPIILDQSTKVTGVVPLPDGRILTGAGDEALHLWDLNTGDLRTLGGHQSGVACAKVLKDSRVLAICEDKKLCVWDLVLGDLKVLDDQAFGSLGTNSRRSGAVLGLGRRDAGLGPVIWLPAQPGDVQSRCERSDRTERRTCGVLVRGLMPADLGPWA